MKKRAKGFYIVGSESQFVYRGPYQHEETAAAVRAEMERTCPAHWNLWIMDNKALDAMESSASPPGV